MKFCLACRELLEGTVPLPTEPGEIDPDTMLRPCVLAEMRNMQASLSVSEILRGQSRHGK